MFLDNPIERIKITDKLRLFIINERQKRGLSASQVISDTDHPQSWIAQIENGRTKTIKNEDLISIFSKILNINELQKVDDYLAEKLINIVGDNSSDDETEKDETEKIDKKSLRKLSKYGKLTESDNEEEFKKQKKFIISAINSMYEEVPEDAVRTLRTFCANIKFDLPFIMGVASLPFVALSDLEEDVTYELYTKIADLLIEYANKDKVRIKRVEVDNDEDNNEQDNREAGD